MEVHKYPNLLQNNHIERIGGVFSDGVVPQHTSR